MTLARDTVERWKKDLEGFHKHADTYYANKIRDFGGKSEVPQGSQKAS